MFCIMPFKEQRLAPLDMPVIDVRPLGAMRRARSYPGFVPYYLYGRGDACDTNFLPMPMDQSVHCNGFNMMESSCDTPSSSDVLGYGDSGGKADGPEPEAMAPRTSHITSEFNLGEPLQARCSQETQIQPSIGQDINLASGGLQASYSQSESMQCGIGQIPQECRPGYLVRPSHAIPPGPEIGNEHKQSPLATATNAQVACGQSSSALAQMAAQAKHVQILSSTPSPAKCFIALPTLLGRNTPRCIEFSYEDKRSVQLKPGPQTKPEAPITTMMIRNLPCELSQCQLLRELNVDFQGLYDFCYLPRDFATMKSKGFAFVNFMNPDHAKLFGNMWQGQLRLGSATALNVSAADLQGLQNNLNRWAGPRMRRIRNPALKPFVADGAAAAL
eukprot:TRINITY_DN19423_c0_g1_i1.p1 TRINITY_DN19423_c0_g1~~TRINITY_DN19423_c0_g1_i1.p1  ORF type:complete len:388 (-),score=49.16 TRINITY_DN19423_c0_g1_i1:165-1328(-)